MTRWRSILACREQRPTRPSAQRTAHLVEKLLFGGTLVRIDSQNLLELIEHEKDGGR
jgi:hypothetical protein